MEAAPAAPPSRPLCCALAVELEARVSHARPRDLSRSPRARAPGDAADQQTLSHTTTPLRWSISLVHSTSKTRAFLLECRRESLNTTSHTVRDPQIWHTRGDRTHAHAKG